MTVDATPWSYLLPYFGSVAPDKSGLPSWVNTFDSQRLAAYALYEDLYRNDPAQYKLMLRGAEDAPIYLPSSRRIVKTLRRYVGRDFGFSIDNVTDAQYGNIATVLGPLFAREAVQTKFSTAKTNAIKLGDGVLLITGNPLKPQGSRLKVSSIDPGTYFPVYNEDDPDTVVGQRIIELYTTEDDKQFIKLQEWLKNTSEKHPAFGNYEAPITYEARLLELTDWEDPTKQKTFQQLQAQTYINGITSLPMYHFMWEAEDGKPFGTSALQGFERIILGINQAITDQDVSLSMAGLGMYAADSTPVDEDGRETDWVIGPRRVVEVPVGGKFERVAGMSSVAPSLEHIQFLQKFMETTLGISDVALGEVDVAVAQSGIALNIRMAPLLDETDEQDRHIRDVLNQMLYDLKAWHKAYEGVDFGEAIITTSFGDKLPKDKDAEANRLQDMYVNRLISKQFYRDQMTALFGYDFPADMDAQIANDMAAEDPYAGTGMYEDELGTVAPE